MESRCWTTYKNVLKPIYIYIYINSSGLRPLFNWSKVQWSQYVINSKVSYVMLEFYLEKAVKVGICKGLSTFYLNFRHFAWI